MAVEVTATFRSPIDEVWALLSDVERMAGLGPEHVAAAWESGGPATGARFTGVNRRGDVEWRVPCVITECQPPAWIAWVVGDPDHPSSTWSYRLEERSDGTTGVVQRFRHGPGISFVRMAVDRVPEEAAAIAEARCASLRSGMAATLDAARRLLDHPPPLPDRRGVGSRL
jgi:uncharacterized protein YndB with AHSA1/START domain